MQYYEVAPNRIVRADSTVLTYASSTPLTPGHIVVIEIGSRQAVAVVMREVAQPSYDTKEIISLVEQHPLPTALLATAQWMADYYHTHFATVLQTLLPTGITKRRRDTKPAELSSVRTRTQNVFTGDQLIALEQIEQMTSGTALLHGVTGSGKTFVYIELARRALARGESVIVLVPEIALTSQLVDEFSAHFDDIILTHSRQTEAERHRAWQAALNARGPRVAIGPRSALFLPLAHVGLIVIDEAHEPTFKQEQAPRYSALRAGSILANHHQAKLVLGSATPLIADYYVAQQSDRPIITMSHRARQDTVPPTIELVDMTKRTHFKRHRFLSDPLLRGLEQTFASGKQALIFHNRRGSASSTLCENCGWQATCPRCFVPLTLHADQHQLRCHICGHTERVPTSCPQCHHAGIIHKGIGTKLIESELRRIFPNKTIMRFDGDATGDQSVDQQYDKLYDGSIDLIIGTQVIAKGLDLPHLRTVGVVQADAGLSLPDFGASERTFQLLAQVVGRVGRSHHETSVIVQSYQPTHPAVVDGLAQDYAHFYATTLPERERGFFPPFSYLLKLTCAYKTETAAIRNAQTLARTLRSRLPADVQLLGPTPAFYERQRDTYRWQIVLRSPTRHHLQTALDHLPPTHWQYELDPMSLL